MNRWGLENDKRGCKGTWAVVFAPFEGEYTEDVHRLWTLGSWIWCTKCGGYATRVPKKLATGCTNVIEKCRQNALRWLKEVRFPMPPHPLVAPSGTRPVRAWAAEPPQQRTGAKALDPDAVLELQALGLAMPVEKATEAFAPAPAVNDGRGGEMALAVSSWPSVSRGAIAASHRV